MLAKISRKNQLTLPQKLVRQFGFSSEEEKYVDIELNNNTLILKPVVVTVEEKIPEEQFKKFKNWALDHRNDTSFNSAEQATTFLKRQMKKE